MPKNAKSAAWKLQFWRNLVQMEISRAENRQCLTFAALSEFGRKFAVSVGKSQLPVLRIFLPTTPLCIIANAFHLFLCSCNRNHFHALLLLVFIWVVYIVLDSTSMMWCIHVIWTSVLLWAWTLHDGFSHRARDSFMAPIVETCMSEDLGQSDNQSYTQHIHSSVVRYLKLVIVILSRYRKCIWNVSPQARQSGEGLVFQCPVTFGGLRHHLKNIYLLGLYFWQLNWLSLNWANISRQLFCDAFTTNLFSWMISAPISFEDVKLETVSVWHSRSLQWFNVIMINVCHYGILQHLCKTKLNTWTTRYRQRKQNFATSSQRRSIAHAACALFTHQLHCV